MTTCTLCDLPTPDPSVTDTGVDGAFCCRGCLEISRRLDPVDEGDEFYIDIQDQPTEMPEGAESAYLSVEGLHCSACEAFLEARATETPGVVDASVNYATDTAKLVYDPAVIDGADLPRVLSGMGYRARFPDDEDTTGTARSGDRRIIVGSLLGMLVMLGYGIVLYPTYLDLPPTAQLGVLVATLVFGMVYTGVALYLSLGALRTALILPVLQAIVLAGVLGSETLSPEPTVIGVGALATVVVFYTGFPFVRGAYVSLRSGQPNMDLLVGLATVSAYAYSVVAALTGSLEVYFDVAVMIVLVVSLGNAIESRLKHRAVSGLASIAGTRLESATRLHRDGRTESVPIEAIEPGDRLVVTAGERIPVDGRVAEGVAAVDEALLTGEALPTTKRPDDEVTGGTLVTDDRLVIEVRAVESTLDRLLDLLWEVQAGESGDQAVADRLAAVFVPFVVVLAIATTALTWWLGVSGTDALLTGIAVLVVSCPCTLGLATPLAIAAGLRTALDEGVIVTDTTMFERIRDVAVVVFDKTGTLTTGKMSVLDVRTAMGPADGGAYAADGAGEVRPTGAETESVATPAEVLAMAAAVEQHANHPVARAITDHADPPSGEVSDIEHHPRGVSATVGGRTVRVGHPADFDPDVWAVPDELEAGSITTHVLTVMVGWDGIVRGVIEVGDHPRPEWGAVVDAFSSPDREVVILTGDDGAAVHEFEAHPGVDEVFAGVPPDAKAQTVRRLRVRGPVAMVGDGSNDAPAIATADLGFAMASGTDLAASAADVVVTAEDLRVVPRAFDIARSTRSRIRQNLGWALSYNAVAIPLAVSGALNPLFAAIAMAASSLIVVGNSSRSISVGAEDWGSEPGRDP